MTENLIKIMKYILVIEHELSRGLHPKDRMLALEAYIKVLKSENAIKEKELYMWSEKLDELLHSGRKKMSIEKMQEFSQDLRKVRKQFEKLDFSIKGNSTDIKRAFNRKGKHPMKPLLEPAFNVLEVYKQLLLLHDHVSDKTLRCPTCILKHTLFAEALSEEALGLDVDGVYVILLRKLVKGIFNIRELYSLNKRNAYADMLKQIERCQKICKGILDNLNRREKNILLL